MCCSGDKTAKATETAQAAFTNTLTDAFKTAFASNQEILNNKLLPALTNAINNPQGFDPRTLALMKTNASDTVTQQTQAAEKAANAYLGSRGGPTLGSGVAAQIEGGIAGAGAVEQARESSNIDIQSGLLQNENYWRAISGLTDVARAENPTGYAGAETSSANSVADLSRAYLASQQAGWQNTFGIISGIAGLGTGAVDAYSGLGFGGKGTSGNTGP